MTKFLSQMIQCCFFAVFILLLLTGCGGPTVDKNTRLVERIKSMEAAVENRHVDDFMAAISDAVETERGWGKKDIERMLRLQLMRRSSVHIHPQLKSIDWRHDGEEEAEVKLAVAMAATAFSLEDLARINADLMLFTVTFRQHNGEYKITQARWQRARPLDFL
jgi:hypothetical protein